MIATIVLKVVDMVLDKVPAAIFGHIKPNILRKWVTPRVEIEWQERTLAIMGAVAGKPAYIGFSIRNESPITVKLLSISYRIINRSTGIPIESGSQRSGEAYSTNGEKIFDATHVKSDGGRAWFEIRTYLRGQRVHVEGNAIFDCMYGSFGRIFNTDPFTTPEEPPNP